MLIAPKPLKSIKTSHINENARPITPIAIINIGKKWTIIFRVRWLVTGAGSVWAIVGEEQELIVEELVVVL